MRIKIAFLCLFVAELFIHKTSYEYLQMIVTLWKQTLDCI